MPRVEQLRLPLEEYLVQELKRQYRSVERFCSSSDEPTFADADQVQSHKQQALGALHKHVLEHFAPPVQSGLSLYARLRDEVRLLPTGCDSLDALLRGGLREGLLTELVGESASGKTQLCMMAAVATAMRGEHVAYLDTSTSFTAQRAAAMYKHLLHQQADALSLRDSLARIAVQGIHDIYALLTALDGWAADLQAATSQRGQAKPLSLLVVDSASAVIAPALGGGQHSQGHALMVCLARLLKHIAAHHQVAVLSTNHVVAGGSASWGANSEGAAPKRPAETRPALGESWRPQAHVRIQLACGDGAARCATLVASALGPCQQSVWFELRDAGAVAVPAPEGELL